MSSLIFGGSPSARTPLSMGDWRSPMLSAATPLAVYDSMQTDLVRRGLPPEVCTMWVFRMREQMLLEKGEAYFRYSKKLLHGQETWRQAKKERPAPAPQRTVPNALADKVSVRLDDLCSGASIEEILAPGYVPVVYTPKEFKTGKEPQYVWSKRKKTFIWRTPLTKKKKVL